jgi:predicted hydrolase (HD superfamily)
MQVTRDAAWRLLTEWTQGDSLRKHALAVDAAVRGYARMQGASEDEWGAVALLHDFDYERYPTLGDHPLKGCEHLTALGYPAWVTRAILSHAWEFTQVMPESPLERALVACDEMAGFVTAAALVRPSRSILDLEASSVKKRMKDKAFARAVPREHLEKGADLMGLPLEQHIANVIAFMRLEADALGLRGTAGDGASSTTSA